jgi:hypothetical protein
MNQAVNLPHPHPLTTPLEQINVSDTRLYDTLSLTGHWGGTIAVGNLETYVNDPKKPRHAAMTGPV